MKPLMLVSPAQAEALYDAHLYESYPDAREAPRLEDRFARLPWVDDDSAEDTELSTRAAQARLQDRHSVQRKAA